MNDEKRKDGWKYVRTANGVYEVEGIERFCIGDWNAKAVVRLFRCRGKPSPIPEDEVVDGSERLADVCDEFWLVWRKDHLPCASTATTHVRFAGIDDLDGEIKKNLDFYNQLGCYFCVYGAIWTDHGLKYVAWLKGKDRWGLLNG